MGRYLIPLDNPINRKNAFIDRKNSPVHQQARDIQGIELHWDRVLWQGELWHRYMVNVTTLNHPLNLKPTRHFPGQRHPLCRIVIDIHGDAHVEGHPVLCLSVCLSVPLYAACGYHMHPNTVYTHSALQCCGIIWHRVAVSALSKNKSRT